MKKSRVHEDSDKPEPKVFMLVPPLVPPPAPRPRYVALEELNPSWYPLLNTSLVPRPKRAQMHALGPLATQVLNSEDEVCMCR